MTTNNRDWIRIAGIVGATLLLVGALISGGMYAANATGLITLPQRGNGNMMGGQGHRDGQGGMFDKGGREGRGGRNGQDKHHGMGMRDGTGMQRSDGTQVNSEEKTLLHTIVMLQQEEALANALASTSPAAKAIATARTNEIATLTAWAKEWYPTATIPAAPSATGTIADLRQIVTHHTLKLDTVTTSATFTHPELQTWLSDALKRRATEATTLFEGQST